MEIERKRSAQQARTVSFSILLALAAPVASGAVTDLSDGPLASGLTSSVAVKPNIGFIFDDSGSMDDQNMPDSEGTNRSKRCWGWYKYNTVFYNPNYTYKPPFKLDGTVYSDGVTRFPDAKFSEALKDGYFPANGVTYGGSTGANTTTNLATVSNLTPNEVSCSSSSGECSGSKTRYYYSIRTLNTDSASCGNDSEYRIVTQVSAIEAPGVSAGSDAAMTNYANWYTYYRSRAMLMKAATAEAFKDLDESKYRIGLFFLNSKESGSNGTTDHLNSDLKIDDFAGSASGTHRRAFFDRLYGARADVYTPLRGALSRMGRLFAGKISGWDPVQYSCQQNFAILSTDGYWNDEYEHGSFGPKMIDGVTNVGNRDGGGAEARPAKATIESDGKFGKACYRSVSLTVERSGSTVHLIDQATPGSCTTNADTFGQSLAQKINDRTSTTGFSASYSSWYNRVTITAPEAWGAFTSTPVAQFEKVGSDGDAQPFWISSFRNGAEAVSGAPLPYLDALNVSDTLADIAYYYYTTDLRDAVLENCSNTIGGTTYSGLCSNNVRGGGKDTATHQHMTTFTIGLGVNGTIKYESNYETAPNIPGVLQYYDIVNGAESWPEPNTSLKKIDDLWHAAVNGRGTYYSAKDATTLQSGILSALSGIQARRGSSAAAATSNLEPVAGDNFVYVALYRTLKWDGDLLAFSIDPATGALSGSPLWSAQTQIDAQVASGAASRNIKYFKDGAADNLRDFNATNLDADGLAAPFTNVCNRSEMLSQCTGEDTLTDAQKASANSSANLVNYLRGDRSHEMDANNTAANQVFRQREHILGDVINAVPVYMKAPPFSFDKYDSTYATFKSDNSARAGTVFLAANDGMLHAIDAATGSERWAFVPTSVMSKMWTLADRRYGDNHRYFVDGSPTVADVCSQLGEDASMCAAADKWRTILVGGLNKGGCSFYALDVTNPATPKGLWEFSNPNLGYTYGNPIVGKREDGRWVVIVSSGYNNYPGNGCGSTGDGNGHVFVLDAMTGALLEDIVTTLPSGEPAGTAATPSGLAELNAWIENASLPVIDRLYGGDLLGNVWRIDFDDNHLPEGKEAVLLAQLKDRNGVAQPVTAKPELAVVGSTVQHPVVLVGTGRYLGNGDLSDTSTQSLYALKDSLTGTGIGNVRGSTMVQRTLTETTGSADSRLAGRIIRTITGDTMSWSAKDGWYFDFNPGNRSPGERVNVDMTLQFNILTVPTNVPADNACDAGGYGFLYFIDINTGLNLSTATDQMAGVRLSGNALVAGIKTVKLTSGRTVTIVTDTAGNVSSEDNPSPSGGGGTGARRSAWREILD